jgi:hypothetical protein
MPAFPLPIPALEEEAAKFRCYQAYSARGEVLFIQKCIEKHSMDFKVCGRTGRHTSAPRPLSPRNFLT